MRESRAEKESVLYICEIPDNVDHCLVEFRSVKVEFSVGSAVSAKLGVHHWVLCRDKQEDRRNAMTSTEAVDYLDDNNAFCEKIINEIYAVFLKDPEL